MGGWLAGEGGGVKRERERENRQDSFSAVFVCVCGREGVGQLSVLKEQRDKER